MVVEVDPIESGPVERLSQTGGNLTGFSGNISGLGGKRLELLQEAVPGGLGATLARPRGHSARTSSQAGACLRERTYRR